VTAHPDDDTWEQLALDELAPARRTEVLAHAAACQACSRIWLGLQTVAHGARAFDPAVPAARSAPHEPAVDELAARRRRQARVLAVAGALAVAAAVLLVALPGRSGDPATGPSVERGDAIEVVVRGPARASAAGAIALDWAPASLATSYRVTVFSEVGRIAWGPVDVTAPPAAIPHLDAGRYRWRVDAIAAGRTVARSALVPLVVDP
jgi:hypothetical protein